jgi:hypothetical protein
LNILFQEIIFFTDLDATVDAHSIEGLARVFVYLEATFSFVGARCLLLKIEQTWQSEIVTARHFYTSPYKDPWLKHPSAQVRISFQSTFSSPSPVLCRRPWTPRSTGVIINKPSTPQ